MINVGLIPLDSRPCNTSWVIDLGKIGNANVIMYPREKCGFLHNGAELDDILSWLNEHVNEMDYLIICFNSSCSICWIPYGIESSCNNI